MSDSADEYREALEGATLQIGDSVVAYTYPLTEGLIIDRRNSEEGRLALTLLIGPYKKKGQNWSRTKVSLRDAARLSKKPPSKFVFPIKGIDKLREEAKKFKSDPVWVAAVKTALDEEFQQREPFSDDSDLDEKEEADNLGESERTVDSLQRNEDEAPAAQRFAELQKRMGEILKLKVEKEDGKKKKKLHKEDEDSDFEEWKKWKREKLRRKQKAKKKRARTPGSSSESSSSSSSSSEEEPRKGEVREKGSTSMFTCPFHKTDARGVKDVKGYVQGQEVTRKNVRVALHNLYAAHYTLVSFADKFVGKAYASPYRPYTMDVNWFQAYAENIDELLLNSLEGPWALWNEPIIDQLVIGFLELLIRVSPHKNYPFLFLNFPIFQE